MTALVSVVMPTLAAGRFVDEAIESMIAQTYDNWELVIVDDGTPGGVPQAIERWANADPRIRVLTHAVNRGLPAALNTGVHASRGDYFTWLSDDDAFRPAALATMVAFLATHPDVDAVYTDYTEIDTMGRPIRRITVEHPDLLGVGNPIGVCHLRRSAVFATVGGYDEELFLAEDLDMWIRLHQQCRIAPLHDDLFLYRQHQRSLTSTATHRVVGVHERVLDRHVGAMPWLDHDGRAWAYIRLARRAVAHRDAIGAARLAGKSVRASPTFVPRKLRARREDRAARRRTARGVDAAPGLLWVYTQPPAATLDSVTWLETTRELRTLGWNVTLVAPGDAGPATIGGVDVLLVARPARYVTGQLVFHARVARVIFRQRNDLDVVLFHEMSAPWLMPLRMVAAMWSRRPRFVMDTRTLHMTAPERQRSPRPRPQGAVRRRRMVGAPPGRWSDRDHRTDGSGDGHPRRPTLGRVAVRGRPACPSRVRRHSAPLPTHTVTSFDSSTWAASTPNATWRRSPRRSSERTGTGCASSCCSSAAVPAPST